MEWAFIWLMVVLKIPIAMLLYIVWWAIKQHEPDAPVSDQDGGVKPPHRPRVPSRRRPRGPHGAPGVAAPPRVRTGPAPVRARADQPHK
jgi:hypothetical protein